LDQLGFESTPAFESETDCKKDQYDRNDVYQEISVCAAILMFGLAILCIAYGFKSGGYLGAIITLMGLPLIFICIDLFFYGFMNFTFP